MRNDRYFNFPIQFLQGFLADPENVYSKNVLDDIIDYAVYSRFLEESGTKAKRLDACETFYGIHLGNKNNTYKNGKELYESIDDKAVMVGINKNMFFDYYKNEKSEFEKVCLLGFLAIKSILQKKAYCKIDNKFWLSRMDGKAKSCEKTALSNQIKKYAKHYQTRKIKGALEDDWNLKTYSHFNRGFYVSFKLDLEDLAFQAEKRKKSNKDKLRKDAKISARKKALEKIFKTPPIQNSNK